MLCTPVSGQCTRVGIPRTLFPELDCDVLVFLAVQDVCVLLITSAFLHADTGRYVMLCICMRSLILLFAFKDVHVVF